MVGFGCYRVADLNEKLRVGGFSPLDVMLAGATGAGKSTIINTLLGSSVARVGYGVDPETQQVDSYRLNKKFRIWDTPGLGDGVCVDIEHKRKITELLTRRCSIGHDCCGLIDLVIVVVEGAHRDVGTCISLLNDVVIPCIDPDRILVVINQADVAMKGSHWNSCTNRPDGILEERLLGFAAPIQRRILESTGIQIKTPVCFSAEYGYNMDKVCDFIIDSVPRVRRVLR